MSQYKRGKEGSSISLPIYIRIFTLAVNNRKDQQYNFFENSVQRNGQEQTRRRKKIFYLQGRRGHIYFTNKF